MNTRVARSVRVRALIYSVVAVCFFSFSWLAIRILTIASVFDRVGVTNSIVGDMESLYSGPLGRALVSQILVIMLIHFVFAFLLWLAADRAMARARWSGDRYLNGSFLFVLVGVYAMFLMNAWFYPNSQYAALPVFGNSIFVVLSSCILTSLLLATALYGCWPFLKSKQRKRAYLATLGLVIAMAVLITHLLPADTGRAERSADQQPAQPDVILIGVDSLRVQELFASRDNSGTPNIDSFLNDATVFERTYSPLSRTFPAWISILSGRYPVAHGLRANLTAQSRLSVEAPLITHSLRQAGYETVYASDEKLFSNIDESYGFDRVSGPPTGGAEFLISKFNDLPLTNLLSNLPVAKHLFPYTTSNRAAYYTYVPESFSNQLTETIRLSDPNKPLFLAAHFCLTHWPYIWRDQPDPNFDIHDADNAYAVSLKKVDNQIGRLIQDLTEAGRLKNAIVVLLSDHGEQFAPGVAAVMDASDLSREIEIKTMGGHGTEVLSDLQNRVLMAFRGFGSFATTSSRELHGPTSLVDIAPTILELTGIGESNTMFSDGISLAARLSDDQASMAERTVFIESGLAVPEFSKAKINIVEIAAQGIDFYEVDTRGRIVIKDEIYDAIMADKQVSAIRRNLQVAVINGEFGAQTIFRNLAKGQGPASRPTQDDMNKLLLELCERFKSDLTSRAGNPCSDLTLTRNTTIKRPDDEIG